MNVLLISQSIVNAEGAGLAYRCPGWLRGDLGSIASQVWPLAALLEARAD